MKGFARIFEAIVASIILVASLTFFFILDVHETGWDNTMLQTTAQDSLYSAYRNESLMTFIKTNNKEGLNSLLSSMLPKTVEYSVRVKGVPNAVIFVACVDCTGSEESELLAILNTTEFSYGERHISIRVENISLANQAPPEETDVLFFFDKNKVNTYSAKIDRLLSAGGSAFLLADLDGSETEYIMHIFNITPGSSGSGPAFFPYVYGGNISHYVAKYYANVTERYIADVAADSFSFHASFADAGNDGRDIVSGGRAFARANYEINKTKGRAVWFGDYTRSDHSLPETKRVDNLLKAAIMWVSGEDYSMDILEKNPAPVNFKSSIMIFDEDLYTIELTLWRVFY